MDGNFPGTLIRAGAGRVAARKQWLAGSMRAKGVLLLDDGAVGVLTTSGKSLLPVGVIQVDGVFERGDLVDCAAGDGRAVVARGLVNYSSSDAAEIAGQPSSQIEKILGYVDEPELIHRDNMVVL